MTNELWVIAEDSAALATLCGAGRALGLPVRAVVLGDVEDAGAYGAQEVLRFATPVSGLVEDTAPDVAALLEERQARLVAASTSPTGTLVAGRVAARLGVPLAAAVESVEVGETLTVRRQVLGGMAVRTEQLAGSAAVVTIGAGTFDPAPRGEAAEVAVETVAAATDSGIRLVDTQVQQVESVNLAVAPRVVSVGRGFAAQEDLALAEALAAAIGAELACSRPVAEGSGWMAKERYVGVTGAKLKPDLYIAVGISGQVQHTSGVDGAKVIVAINKDKDAPIFADADFGLVADLYEALPLLTAQL
ncbi:electron transfer flavoprotein subunit alpha/FixB family protein [Xylanimonas allomyrinae]|uniref:Electron transfer flavoprotein subunit alpha/FixB family protein n=1 Tax=Xylanimonas allomyrinae TaxID=2509459 RepID=A0A4P6EVM3_9MICO|nr:electron transfer flavoprotein subunit alpha/FixB family protein [Xylanimonas allomyrinae]QAY64547.1 electron transfer flavoprotein subunit alpha/FixB family protein [Xylanimonas allomyrinae]